MTNHPVLYILMRSDMDSLNPGKAMAQAAHAASLFAHDMETIINYDKDYNVEENVTRSTDILNIRKNVYTKYIIDLYAEWLANTGTFGTKIVLDCASEWDLLSTCKAFDESEFALTNVVKDPTYPVKDGDVTHLIDISTCGYVFLDKDLLDDYNDDSLPENLIYFDLYP